MVTSAMTAALDPELAAAYVRELSAVVSGVVVLDSEGAHLAGPEAMAGPARALADLVDGGATVSTNDGIVWIAKGPDRTVVAAAEAAGQPGPTALDVAAAAGASTPSMGEEEPSEPLRSAASDVLEAT
jgi:hypothetical protein